MIDARAHAEITSHLPILGPVICERQEQLKRPDPRLPYSREYARVTDILLSLGVRDTRGGSERDPKLIPCTGPSQPAPCSGPSQSMLRALPDLCYHVLKQLQSPTAQLRLEYEEMCRLEAREARINCLTSALDGSIQQLVRCGRAVLQDKADLEAMQDRWFFDDADGDPHPDVLTEAFLFDEIAEAIGCDMPLLHYDFTGDDVFREDALAKGYRLAD